MSTEKEVLQLMQHAILLKEVSRTGWNKKFPKGSKYKSRKVKNAESVADHSFGTAMLAFFLGSHLKVNIPKLVTMCLVHDIFEATTGDIVTTTLNAANKKRKVLAKQEMEVKIAKQFSKIGQSGKQIAKLWREIEEGKTQEAKLAVQLDKLEMNFQAVRYFLRGDTVDPIEFIDSTVPIIQTPELQKIVKQLRLRAQKAAI